MPAANPVAIRKQLASGKADPVYLIVGDDEAEMSQLANEIAALVEDELRAFNLERLYASDKSTTPSAIVQAARTLPMLGDRRVVLVLRAERILKPKRRAKAVEAEEDAGGAADEEEVEPPTDLDAIEAYVKSPEPNNTLVFVAADVDRQRKVYKALQKHATIIECWGLKGEKDPRFLDLRQVARQAEALVKQAVTAEGQQIDPAAARLLAERAGADISTLRAEVERVLLFAAGKPKITLQDAREVVSGATAHDDWAVTNAISRGDTADALRHLGLALESGGVSYQILGQLAWFVREKLSVADPRRMPAAVDALFRTDIELKSSAGDPRVLLERLVVELCRR
jgi:DNA polymerase-3 subunit delta